MQCPNCGAEVTPGDVFCGECGARLPRERKLALPVIGAVVAALVLGALCVGSLAVIFWPRPTPTPEAVAELSPTIEVQPSRTPTQVVVAVASPTRIATPTYTTVPVRAFSNVFFAAGVTDAGDPTDVAARFPQGTIRVYAFASYEGMNDGAQCESVFYLDGEEDTRHPFEWSYGESGERWIVNIYNDDGLLPGRYDWELYADGELVTTGRFAVGELVGVLFRDDFSNPGSGWDVGDYDNGSVGYQDLIYLVIASETNMPVQGMANRFFDDLVIEVMARQVSAGPTDNNDYGVVCRGQPNGDGYFFAISGDGFYGIWRKEHGEFEALVDWATSDTIHRGNATNSIRAVCDGADLALFVNGELLAQASDSTFSEGDIGLAATTYEDEPTEIHFDDLVVFEAAGESE